MIKLKQICRMAAFAIIASLILAGLSSYSGRNDGYPNVTIDNYHSGDCKYAFNGQIVGSRNGTLTLLNPWTKEVTTVPDVQSNWSDVLPAERLVVYSGGLDSKITGIVKFDYFNTVIYNRTILTAGDDLRIDPTIIKIGKTYYMTSTLIKGTVNQSDPNAENGYYTIEMYSSEDLKNWTHISDIAAAENNLEDVDIMADGDVIRVTYERETRDKAPSTILQVSSADGGKTWSSPVTLVSENADNEPTTFIKEDGSYYMFYSSDYHEPGRSYNGASAYVAKFDSSMNPVSTDELITIPSDGILLYEAAIRGNQVQLLFASDYLGSDNLQIQTVALP